MRYLILDRDSKFTARFQRILRDAGVDIVTTAYQAPNMNAFAERWVLSVKSECLSKMILLGERSLLTPSRYSWAELLRRTFLIDVLACPCGARRRVLRMVCDPAQIHRCLTHLGLPTEAPARAPPEAGQGVLGF